METRQAHLIKSDRSRLYCSMAEGKNKPDEKAYKEFKRVPDYGRRKEIKDAELRKICGRNIGSCMQR